jgi:hypothetical protein
LRAGVIILADEEHKLAASDTNLVSVSNRRIAYLNPVDERPVVTVEVGSFINALGDVADGAVLSRDCGVADHDLVGRAPAPETANRQL